MYFSVLIFVCAFLILLWLAYTALQFISRRQGSFKIVIENGVITSHSESIPSEFLYDVQQIARIEKLQYLIIKGSGIKTSSPKLFFQGEISPQLQEKFSQSLTLSL